MKKTKPAPRKRTASSAKGRAPARRKASRARRSKAKTAPQIAPQEVVRLITEQVLIRARERRNRGMRPEDVKPFAFPLHPPGVAPDRKGMAQDEALSEVAGWASGNTQLSEGIAFLGYAYLAQLAQRPEYRRMSERIAGEMTRKWIELYVKGDTDSDKPKAKRNAEKIEKLNEELERLHVRDAFREAAEQDGFFGRSHVYPDFGNTNNRDELKTSIGDGSNRATKAKVSKGSLKAVRTVEAVWTYPMGYNSSDPLSTDWYKPRSWYVMSRELHASRLLTFVGREVPDILKPAYSFGGLSLSQMAKPYVDNWLETRQSVADIISAFNVFVLMTDMVNSLQKGGDDFFNRLDLFNACRDNRGIMAIDKNAEDFKNVAAPLGSLDLLQAQTQEHMAAVSGIPLVILLGISPHGLNASSEGELRAFYDWIGSYQEHLFRKNLTKLLNIVQLSLFGIIDPAIAFKFVPLYSLDEKEESEVQKNEAERDAVLVDAGIIHTHEARKRLANDPNSGYGNIEVDDVPEEELDEDDDVTGAETDTDDDETLKRAA